ncbi:MAG: CATRA conflict system CASPASE/TPR repeat-associated protein [Pseudonocardiaceae bacterium]
MTTPTLEGKALEGKALVVHLFVAADGQHRDAGHDYLRRVWRACEGVLGMTEPITMTGLPMEPPAGWDGACWFPARDRNPVASLG